MSDIPGRGKRVMRLFAALAVSIVAATVLTGVAAPSAANAVVVGVCTIKANDPHPSAHVSGTINAVGTVTCTVVMDEIYLAVWLEKSTGSSWSSFPFYDYYNTSAASENAATSCGQGPGVFRTRVAYVLRAPAGYSPSYASNNFTGPWKNVACGVGFTAAPTDETTFEVDIPLAGS